MFAKEVELADCYQTILRGNGLPTKIMSFCFKLYGSHYLYNLFAPLLAKISMVDVRNYEVDPSRTEQHEQLEENIKNLCSLTQDVFEAIIDSASQFPAQLRILCSCLDQVVQHRFPEHHLQVRRSFLERLFSTDEHRRIFEFPFDVLGRVNSDISTLSQPSTSFTSRVRHR